MCTSPRQRRAQLSLALCPFVRRSSGGLAENLALGSFQGWGMWEEEAQGLLQPWVTAISILAAPCAGRAGEQAWVRVLTCSCLPP